MFDENGLQDMSDHTIERTLICFKLHIPGSKAASSCLRHFLLAMLFLEPSPKPPPPANVMCKPS